MKRLIAASLATLSLMMVSLVHAEAPKGLKEGDKIGAFHVTKAGGAEADHVEAGSNLCYRCKYSARPQVIVFTRSSDDKVVKLAQQLDAQLKAHEDVQLRAFVNVLGKNKDAAMDQAKKMAAVSKTSNVPFVVPDENENGPENYELSPNAELVVLVAKDGTLVSNMSGSVKDLDIEKVLAQVKKIVN